MLFNCLLAIRRLCINLLFFSTMTATLSTDRIGKNMQMTKAEFQIVKESDREKTERDVLHIIRCKNMLIKCSAQFPFRPITTTKMD